MAFTVLGCTRRSKSVAVWSAACTVHFASEVYDEGPIIVQKSVELEYEDSPETIAAKVFAAECEAFPEALNRVNEKGVDFFWQRVQS